MNEQDRTPLIAEAATPGPEARPAGPAKPKLTRGQRQLVMTISGFVAIIAAIGFAGSYTAVTKLARAKGFGWFAWAFPAGIDAGIGGFLALDLLLTWLRMPYPLLRYIAWALTVGTICFNASTAWGDWLAVGMHAVVPLLFVAAIEAARHATGRVADITANRFIESPPLVRWILDPVGTFRIWRRMRLWQLASYNAVIQMERDREVFRARLQRRYGRKWKTAAADHEVLALLLARYGTPIQDALAESRAEVETPQQGATEAPQMDASERPATTAQSATADATQSAPERHGQTPQSATADATEAPLKRHQSAPVDAIKAPRKAPSKRPSKSPRGAALDAIRALYDEHGRRPLESEMIAALKQIRSPHTSRQFANKLRAEIEKEHPELAALGQDNVRPLTGTDA